MLVFCFIRKQAIALVPKVSHQVYFSATENTGLIFTPNEFILCKYYVKKDGDWGG